jgi:hypothetical protein
MGNISLLEPMKAKQNTNETNGPVSSCGGKRGVLLHLLDSVQHRKWNLGTLLSDTYQNMWHISKHVVQELEMRRYYDALYECWMRININWFVGTVGECWRGPGYGIMVINSDHMELYLK